MVGLVHRVVTLVELRVDYVSLNLGIFRFSIGQDLKSMAFFAQRIS